MIRPPIFAVRLLLAAALLPAAIPMRVAHAAPVVAAAHPAGAMTEHRFVHDGVERAYRVYRPEGYREGGRAILLLHGGAQSMRKIFVTGAVGWPAWRELADREGVLLIMPNGLGIGMASGLTDTQRWNDLRFPDASPPDDTDFLATTLRRVRAVHAYDPAKLHGFGSSSGGLMLLRALQESPGLVTSGVAALAALPESPARAAVDSGRPRAPVLFINGLDDKIIPAAGGQILDSPVRMRPVDTSVRTWETWRRGVDPGPPERRDTRYGDAPAREFAYRESGDDAGTRAILLEGAGHHLPSLAHPAKSTALTEKYYGPVTRAFETAEVAYAYFLKNENRR